MCPRILGGWGFDSVWHGVYTAADPLQKEGVHKVRRTQSMLGVVLVLLVACSAWVVAQTGNGSAYPPNTGGLFVDVPIDHWAYEDIVYLNERGIITGLPGGEFNGDDPLDRYSAAAMIARAVRYMENNPQSVTAQDLDTLRDLIFRVSDDVDQLSTEINSIEVGGNLASQVSANTLAIQQIQAQLDGGEATDDSALAGRVSTNFILSVTALLLGITGIALSLVAW